MKLQILMITFLLLLLSCTKDIDDHSLQMQDMPISPYQEIYKVDLALDDFWCGENMMTRKCRKVRAGAIDLHGNVIEHNLVRFQAVLAMDECYVYGFYMKEVDGLYCPHDIIVPQEDVVEC